MDRTEAGLENKEAEKHPFLDLARQFEEASDPAECDRLREELARLTFGD